MSKKRPITVEDLWACARVGKPAPAPDGSWSVVPVVTYSMEENKATKRLYRMESGSSTAIPLTAEKQNSSGPAVSPDGRTLAFVRDDDDKVGQVALMPINGGEAEIITEMPHGVSALKWFSDGKRIAFLSQVYKNALTLEAAKKHKKKLKEDKVKAYVSEDAVVRYWDHWITDGLVFHIFVLDLETRKVTDVTPDSIRMFDPDDPSGSFDISPDGKEIAFTADRSDPPHNKLNWDLFLLDLETGTVRNLTEANPGHEINPRYSPDGKNILYGMQTQPEFYADKVRLTVYDRAAGLHTVLTEDWKLSAAVWEFLPDGKVALIAEDRACHTVFVTELKPGEPTQVYRGASLTSLTAVDSDRLVVTRDDASNPAELFVLSLTDGSLNPWSEFNKELKASWNMGEVSEHYVDGADGEPVQYYRVLPPDFDPSKKWPMILAVHGGPHGIWGDTFHFRWNMQLFAAKGYVVVAPNPHGSTSWGQEYAQCIQGGWGDKPHTDCMAVVDDLVATGFVDAKRIAAAGGSYGGYMMAWFAGHTDRFACIVNHAGCSNLLSMYASDITEDWGAAVGADPWVSLEPCDAMNPVRFAKNFKTPMLVIHGELDYRVPVTQGLEIYSLYKRMGLEARLLVYPDENHWILKPQNSRLWYQEFDAWVERWTGGGGPK